MLNSKDKDIKKRGRLRGKGQKGKGKMLLVKVARRDDLSIRLGAESLEDMIAASRIATARVKGVPSDVEPSAVKAHQLAKIITTKQALQKKGVSVSFHQLNRAIVERNAKENSPTEEVRMIYNQMKEEE